MTEIRISFAKVSMSPVAYTLENLAGYITGKEPSVFHLRNRNPESEKFCGFYLPPFQRGEVWTDDQKIRFMESLFCELPVAPLMFVNNCDLPQVDGWLIDGQQRMSAIRDFVNGGIRVFNDELGYDNMSETVLARPIDNMANAPQIAGNLWRKANLIFQRIEGDVNVPILKELYERMNFGGAAHTEDDRLKLRMY